MKEIGYNIKHGPIKFGGNRATINYQQIECQYHAKLNILTYYMHIRYVLGTNETNVDSNIKTFHTRSVQFSVSRTCFPQNSVRPLLFAFLRHSLVGYFCQLSIINVHQINKDLNTFNYISHWLARNRDVWSS